MDKEFKIRDIKRRIDRYKKELQELQHDLPMVINKNIADYIESEIDRIKKRIKYKSFELWELTEGK